MDRYGLFPAYTVIALKQEKNAGHVNGFYPMVELDRVWILATFFIFMGITIMLAYFGNTAFIYGKF